MLKFDESSTQMSPHEHQPHGLCLLVAGGVIDAEEVASLHKSAIAKLCVCIGQLCSTPGALGDAEKMAVIKKHWKWYDPEKGDAIDAANGEVSRAGAKLSDMVGGEGEEEGVTYPEER